MRAAYWGTTDVVVELVKAGANLDLQNEVMSSGEYRYSRWSVMIRTDMYLLPATLDLSTNSTKATSSSVCSYRIIVF